MIIPTATYRIQFSADFTFKDLEKNVDYLEALGISTIYASPIYKARAGSTHGYDVTDATMLNPEITDVGSADFIVWDDCFCFPNLYVRVTRAYQTTLTYTDLKGKAHTMHLEGAMAELLQHEIDHLDGILAVDRATGLDPFAYRTEWEKRHELSERYGSPRPRELA